MAASYPISVKAFRTRKNITDIINDSNVNDVQDEITAIETALGLTPTLSTINATTATYDNTGVNYGTVAARLANIEAGVVGDSHAQYVKIAGNSTITSASTSTVNLTFSAITSQTADLTQWKSAGNVITKVASDGQLYTNGQLVASNNDVNNLYVLFMFDQI